MTTSALSDVLRSELLKIRTSPATWGFAAVIVLLTALNTSLTLGDPLTQIATEPVSATSSPPAGLRRALHRARRDRRRRRVPPSDRRADLPHHTGALSRPGRQGPRPRCAGLLVALACVAVQMALALPWLASSGEPVVPWDAAVAEPALTAVLAGLAYAAHSASRSDRCCATRSSR